MEVFLFFLFSLFFFSRVDTNLIFRKPLQSSVHHILYR